MNVYCIPGFGIDGKIFSNLKISGVDLHPIDWLDPAPHESLSSYAQRMAEPINDASPIIIGLSFGGMIAVELAKIRDVKKTILISSVKTRAELPLSVRLAGFLKLNRLFPLRKIPQSDTLYALANRRLGARTSDEKQFVNGYRRTAKLNYVNWSFDQIVNWQNTQYPADIVHIHGDKDHIFPIRYVKPTHRIRGGTHMMIWNRADEISSLISQVLAGLKI
jgi:pimeloyl-ACP methyl ester carboxylesterase